MSRIPIRNRLLAALPPEEYRRLKPSLTATTLEHHKLLEDGQDPITHVYFPWGGVCSLTATMSDGRMVEVGTIGKEGLVGMAAYFGGRLRNTKTMVQVPGEGADVMNVRAFVGEMAKEGALYQVVRRYSQALLALMAQSVACNALHDVNQRCARWLLMTHDRVGGDTLLLTQEYLATMLGVRRSSVTGVAKTLQRKRLIEYSRGRIVILDRPGLLKLTCECYSVTREELERRIPTETSSVRFRTDRNAGHV
jgi:CRP-like cAMP-binding protein